MARQVTESTDAGPASYPQGAFRPFPKDRQSLRELFHSLIVDKFVWIQGAWGEFLMNTRSPRATSLALRANLEREQSRLALVLVALMSLATVSIIAATQALSDQHQHQISVERSR
jgi:hypothetical protein